MACVIRTETTRDTAQKAINSIKGEMVSNTSKNGTG